MAQHARPENEAAAPQRGLIALAVALAPLPAGAHAFGGNYLPPLPAGLYAYGVVAVVLLTVLLLAVRVLPSPPVAAVSRRGEGWQPGALAQALLAGLRRVTQMLVMLSLLLCIASGLVGSEDPQRNINMTLVWIVLLLGVAYVNALFGEVFAPVNPGRTLIDGAAMVYSAGRHVFSLPAGRTKPAQPRRRWPRGWGIWPATVQYMLLISVPMVMDVRPVGVSVVLMLYIGLTVVGVGLFGARVWFACGDMLGVFFRLFSRMAPLRWSRNPDGQVRVHLRAPFAGLRHRRARHLSEIVLILFLLSSVAFDGLRETRPWFTLIWLDSTGLVEALVGQPPLAIHTELRAQFAHGELVLLWLSPWLGLGLVALAVALGERLTPGGRGHRLRVADYAYSLLPMAVCYYLAHYLAIVMAHGPTIRALASDPFGWGWDLWGTALSLRAPLLIDVNALWHAQVALIVLGHVASVDLAYRVARHRCPQPSLVLRRSAPMLLLLTGLALADLWILAQPLV